MLNTKDLPHSNDVFNLLCDYYKHVQFNDSRYVSMHYERVTDGRRGTNAEHYSNKVSYAAMYLAQTGQRLATMRMYPDKIITIEDTDYKDFIADWIQKHQRDVQIRVPVQPKPEETGLRFLSPEELDRAMEAVFTPTFTDTQMDSIFREPF